MVIALSTLQVTYNGIGDRVAQTVGAATTHLALDCALAPFRAASALPEVIYTSSGESYLHLPGVIMTEKAGQRRYLLPDGLGSIRRCNPTLLRTSKTRHRNRAAKEIPTPIQKLHGLNQSSTVCWPAGTITPC